MAPHSSTPAWKIPWTEEPGRLQSMGSLPVGYDWATSLSLFTFMHWRRKWQPTPVFLPGEPQGRESLVGCHLWGHTIVWLQCRRRVGHDWSDLAAAAAAGYLNYTVMIYSKSVGYLPCLNGFQLKKECPARFHSWNYQKWHSHIGLVKYCFQENYFPNAGHLCPIL